MFNNLKRSNYTSACLVLLMNIIVLIEITLKQPLKLQGFFFIYGSPFQIDKIVHDLDKVKYSWPLDGTGLKFTGLFIYGCFSLVNRVSSLYPRILYLQTQPTENLRQYIWSAVGNWRMVLEPILHEYQGMPAHYIFEVSKVTLGFFTAWEAGLPSPHIVQGFLFEWF